MLMNFWKDKVFTRRIKFEVLSVCLYVCVYSFVHINISIHCWALNGKVTTYYLYRAQITCTPRSQDCFFLYRWKQQSHICGLVTKLRFFVGRMHTLNNSAISLALLHIFLNASIRHWTICIKHHFEYGYLWVVTFPSLSLFW